MLIGDPKQAIYAFRGADVYAYLAAARAAGARATLRVNWRSDQGLIDAYDALFGGARLGQDGIEYREVRAADANRAPRLAGAPVAAPLRVRVLHRDQPGVTRTAARLPVQRVRARAASPRTWPATSWTCSSSGARIERRGARRRDARHGGRCSPGTSRCSCAGTSTRP